MTTSADPDHKLEIRNLRVEDYPDVRVIMDRVYRGMGGAWTPEEYQRLLAIFPEGQLCIADKGRVVAAALTLVIDYAKHGERHSYDDIVSSGEFTNHDPDGDYLYGIDLFVHPDYRGMRLGRRLYDARKELCEKLNLKGILVGGRIPGYAAHAATLTPKQYIEKVRQKEIVDRVLTFQLANDFHPKRAIENECYVAITGSVGNLPKVENMDIQYSQSAIFTPSDFAFPHDATAAEATPNTEMTLVTDLDLDLLKELRRQGSVRNLQSRRSDLYEIRWKGAAPAARAAER